MVFFFLWNVYVIVTAPPYEYDVNGHVYKAAHEDYLAPLYTKWNYLYAWM